MSNREPIHTTRDDVLATLGLHPDRATHHQIADTVKANRRHLTDHDLKLLGIGMVVTRNQRPDGTTYVHVRSQ